MPSATELEERWEARHPGFAVGDGLVAGWLRLVWRLARPLAAAGVSPDVVTVAGAAAAVGAVGSRPGTRGPLLVAGSVLDGLDGAVAVLTDHVSSYGATLDHTADRVADLAAAAVLVRSGAPWQLVAPAVVGTFALELSRGRVPPLVTVAERPTRVVCGALGDVAAAVTGRRWPAVVAAGVWNALAAVALVQLVRVARRAAPEH